MSKQLPKIETADFFDALSTHRRRLAIILVDEFDNIDISTAADAITAYEFDEVNSKNRQAVYTGLYQSHAGKLDEANLIEFDDRNVMHRTKHTELAAEFIKLAYQEFKTDEDIEEIL